MIARPIKWLAKRALRRMGVLDETPALSAHEQRQLQLDQSCAFFRHLAGLPGVQSVTFDRDSAIVTLADGRRYILDPAIKAGRLYSVPFTGVFEPDETRFVRSLIRPGDVCADVGASFGWFTVMLSRLAGAHGCVHAFEPIRETAELLERNLELNNCRNVYVNRIALDKQDARREIYVPDIGVSGSFQLHDYRESYDTELVTTMTLDKYVELQEVKRIDFIKADIEGAEFAMLQGAAKTIERFHPVLLLEVQASSTRLFGYEPNELFDFLAGHGYRPHCLTGDEQPSPIESYDADLPAYNFVFLHHRKTLAQVA